MTDAERQAAEAFDRFLDRLLAGDPNQPAAGPHDTPADLVSAARHLHAIGARRFPQSSRSRIWSELMASFRAGGGSGEGTMSAFGVLPPNPNGGRPGAPWDDLIIGSRPDTDDGSGNLPVVQGGDRGEALDVQSPPRNGRRVFNLPRPLERWFPALVSAALLLLALGIGVGTIWPTDRGDSNGPGGPAIQAPATPLPSAPYDTVLLEIPLPADVPLPDVRASADLAFYTFAAGATTSWEGNDSALYSGIWVTYVVTGRITVRSEDAAEVIRVGSDGTPELLSAGTETTLEPGDAVIRRIDGGAVWTNAGATEAGLLQFSVNSGVILGPYFRPPEWHDVHHMWADRLQLPDRYLLRLEVTELEPNEVLPALPEPNVQVGITTLPTLDGYLAKDSKGQLILRGAAAPMTVYRVTLELAAELAAPPEQ